MLPSAFVLTLFLLSSYFLVKIIFLKYIAWFKEKAQKTPLLDLKCNLFYYLLLYFKFKERFLLNT